MAKTSISLPQELADRIKEAPFKRGDLSRICARAVQIALIENGEQERVRTAYFWAAINSDHLLYDQLVTSRKDFDPDGDDDLCRRLDEIVGDRLKAYEYGMKRLQERLDSDGSLAR